MLNKNEDLSNRMKFGIVFLVLILVLSVFLVCTLRKASLIRQERAIIWEDNMRQEISSPMPLKNIELLCMKLNSLENSDICSPSAKDIYAHHFLPFIQNEFIGEDESANSYIWEVNQKLKGFERDCGVWGSVYGNKEDEYCDYDLRGDWKNLIRITYSVHDTKVLDVFLFPLD